jgi:hypothetical protein
MSTISIRHSQRTETYRSETGKKAVIASEIRGSSENRTVAQGPERFPWQMNSVRKNISLVTPEHRYQRAWADWI